MNSVNVITRTFIKENTHITAIFADTFDSGLDLCPGCKIKRAEGRVQKWPFTSRIIENKKPVETFLSNLRKLLSPSSLGRMSLYCFLRLGLIIEINT